MIRTGLPYNIEQLTEIQQNGAIIQMDQLDFTKYTMDDPILVALVYLRNTAFEKITLETSQMPYRDKERFLQYYLTKDLVFKQKNIIASILSIIDVYLGQDIVENSIFTHDECETFIANNSTLILELLSIIKSLPLFIIDRCSCLQNRLVFDLPQHESKFEFKNLCNIVSEIDFEDVLSRLTNVPIPICFYTNIFKIESDELFKLVSETMTGFFLTSDKIENIFE